MKKFLLAALSLLVMAQCGLCAATNAPATESVLKDLKNAIVTDVTTNVNNVKLASYKAQLAQKQQELKEVNESSGFAIIKYFKRERINNKIIELEAKIAQIEAAQAN